MRLSRGNPHCSSASISARKKAINFSRIMVQRGRQRSAKLQHVFPDAAAYEGNCRKQAWLLKNFLLASKRQNLGDRKCLGDPRKSLIGHPDAISFSRISGFGLFQQPQVIALIDGFWRYRDFATAIMIHGF